MNLIKTITKPVTVRESVFTVELTKHEVKDIQDALLHYDNNASLLENFEGLLE